MWVKLRLVAATAAWLFAASLSLSHVAAQGPLPEGKIWTGVYTIGQATQGEATYGSMCARCHANDLSGGQVGAAYAPALGGEKFLASWESRNAERLFRTIRDTMPRGTPGLLNDQNAAELVAYILKFNGFPAGTAPLPTATAALEAVVVIPRPGAIRREASDFAAVQASGCVASGPGGSLVLTKASEPVASPATGPMVALAVTSGVSTLRLVSPGRFHLDARVGEQVMVKGLLRRDPDETLINLIAVEPSGVRCN